MGGPPCPVHSEGLPSPGLDGLPCWPCSGGARLLGFHLSSSLRLSSMILLCRWDVLFPSCVWDIYFLLSTTGPYMGLGKEKGARGGFFSPPGPRLSQLICSVHGETCHLRGRRLHSPREGEEGEELLILQCGSFAAVVWWTLECPERFLVFTMAGEATISIRWFKATMLLIIHHHKE